MRIPLRILNNNYRYYEGAKEQFALIKGEGILQIFDLQK